MVTRCYKQSNLLTRKCLGLGSTLTLMKISKLLGASRKIIRGYKMGVVEPYVMRGLQPAGATRVTLDVIIPSPTGLTPEKWKQTATLCPLDWPSNYSLLRLWHMTKGLHQFADQLRKQMNHRHMGRGMGSPIPCVEQGEVDPRGSGGTLNWCIALGSC